MTSVNPWQPGLSGSASATSKVWDKRFRKASLWLGGLSVLLGSLCLLDALLNMLVQGYTGALWMGPSCQSPAIGFFFVLTGLSALTAWLLPPTSAIPRPGMLFQWLLGTPVLLFGLLTCAGTPIPGILDVDALTGLLFVFLGSSIVLEGTPLHFAGILKQPIVFAAFFLCGMVLVGYTYESGTHLTGIVGYLNIPAFTALLGIISAHALLFQQPGLGIMKVLSGAGFGSQAMRRLIPLTVVLLVAVGWFVTYGRGHAWYPAALGDGLFAALAIAGFSAILLLTAKYLNRLDADRRSREWELKRNQEELRAVIDNAGAIICMKDTEGRYQLVNRKFCEVSGKSAEACLGRTADELFPGYVAGIINRSFLQALETGSAVECIETIESGSDGSYSYLSANIPLFDADGNAYAVCGIYTDVTELREQKEEIHRLNDSLVEETRRQAAANDELEAFSYSVSHDLRAPLRHIAGFAQLLAQRNKDGLDDKSRHYLEVIQNSVTRMGALIDDLLAFSRANKVELKQRRVQTTEMVREIRHELEAHTSGPQAEWHLGELPDMQGDPALLRLAWVNLLSNALKYSGKNAAPRIEVGYGPVGDVTGAYWVRDNGVGFDMQYADKLFGVFHRLHSSKDYEGTGIGLALVRRILERHGGAIWAESAPGEGACFYFVASAPEASASGDALPKGTPA